MAEYSKVDILRSLYNDKALPPDKMALIKSLEDEGQLEPALQALSQNQQFLTSLSGQNQNQPPEQVPQKEGFLQTAARNIRPYLQAGGATAGGIVGAGSGLFTGPGAVVASPAGAVAGGALGYAIGDELADLLENFAGTRKPQPLSVELPQAVRNVAEGMTYEMGGQAAGQAIGQTVKTVAGMPGVQYAVQSAKELAGKVPAMTEAATKKLAGKILMASTSKGPLIAKNIDEARAIEEAIPGLEFSFGQLTNDPALLKMERASAREPGQMAQNLIDQQNRNDAAIRDFLKSKRPEGEIEDTLKAFGGQQEALTAAEKTAQLRLQKETAQLGMGAGQLEAGQTIRAEAEAAKMAAKQEGKKLYQSIPGYDEKIIDVSKLADQADALTKPMNKLENVEANVPWQQINKLKEVLANEGNVVSLKDLDGFQSELKAEIRKIKGGPEVNERKLSRLTQLNNQIEKILDDTANSVKIAETKWHNLGAEERLQYYNPNKIKENGPFKVWDFDEEKFFTFDNKEKYQAWLDKYPFANVSEPVGQLKTYYRFGKPPENFRSWNAAEQKPELGVSVYTTPEGTGAAAFFADRKIYSGKGRQVGWGSDGEPVIIPEGKWEEFKQISTKLPSEALKKARTFWKTEVIDKFKKGDIGDILANKGGGEYRVSDAQISSKFFKPGPAGQQAARQFKNSIGGSQKAMQAIEDAAKQDLLAKFPNGEITEAGLKTWLSRNKLALKELNITSKFDDLTKAREQLTDAISFQNEFNRSEAAKLLGSDPQTAIVNALNKGSKGKAAANLMQQTKGNKAAQAGLRNALDDYILEQAQNPATGMITRLDKLDSLLKKYAPARNVFYEGDKEALKAWQQGRDAFRIAARGTKSPLGGGSDTAENILTSVFKSLGVSSGRVGSLVRAFIDPLKKQEMNKVNALVNQALLNPDFAYTLMLAADSAQPGIVKGTLPKFHISGRKQMIKEGVLPEYLRRRLSQHFATITGATFRPLKSEEQPAP